jgi:thiol-disulfide isomerase/thioredoxin
MYVFCRTQFYAPWCGHCKKAKPEVIELCGKAQGYRVVTVDAVATQNSRIAREFNVNSYPTFVFMRNGAGSVQEPFRGDMTADGMDKWVQRRLSAPALSDAASITDVFPADEASPPTVVAVYAPSSWDKVKPEIIKLATLGRDDFRTSIITDAALAASLGLSADGMMGVYHLNSHQVARGAVCACVYVCVCVSACVCV